MISAKAGYFDGRTAVRNEVLLIIDNGDMGISGQGIQLSYPVAALKLSDGVGSVVRTVRLPNDGICEVTDSEFVAELEKGCARSVHSKWVHHWEKSLSLVLAGLVLLALVIALFLRYGVPALAYQAAFAIPEGVEENLGRDTLATLDSFILKPSGLKQARRDELTLLFKKVNSASPKSRIEFRSCPALGANAIALPSGIVVLTDGLAEMAKDDDEIAAVLAHEIGHVKLRHGIRHLLQNSVTALIMVTVTGDLMSVTSLSAALPTALVDASFSRDFEREADDAALTWMKSAGVPPRRYAEILARLQAQIDARKGGSDSGPKFRNYLSTHPDTGDRIKRIMGQAGG